MTNKEGEEIIIMLVFLILFLLAIKFKIIGA